MKGQINGFRTGVSLHCHTQHSKEVLDLIPDYAERLPLVARKFHIEKQRYRDRHGKDLDFTSAYWTPPLSAREVYDLEKEQIENLLTARTVISITDHDTIESCSRLLTLEDYQALSCYLNQTPQGDGISGPAVRLLCLLE
jgi:hypothetical protein